MVIDTEKDPELGWIAREPKNIIWSQPDDGPLYAVVRIATPGDLGRHQQKKESEEKFETASIRMAKEQALPISANGLAGACGRLRCCLRYEYEQYRQINRAMPRIGEEVNPPHGSATVIVGHRLQETVSVRYRDDRVLEWPLAQLSRLSSSRN